MPALFVNIYITTGSVVRFEIKNLLFLKTFWPTATLAM
jgi:hypothetical protein